MAEFDTESVSETMLSDNNAEPEKRKPGRPRLTEAEKAARASARAEVKDSAPARGRGRGRPLGRKDLPMIRESLEQFVTMAGLGLSAIPNPRLQADGYIIVQGSENFAKSWCELARTDVRVYNALRKICVGGAWGGVIIATASIVVPIAANHELVPPFVASVFGSAMQVETDEESSLTDVSQNVDSE
jgi:hypothetical protein